MHGATIKITKDTVLHSERLGPEVQLLHVDIKHCGTNSTKQISSREPRSCLASQEVPRLVFNPNVHNRFYKLLVSQLAMGWAVRDIIPVEARFSVQTGPGAHPAS